MTTRVGAAVHLHPLSTGMPTKMQPWTVGAATWAAGRVDLFVVGVGRDQTMQRKIWNQSAWMPSATDCESFGGSFSSPGVIVSAATEKLDIFACGKDGQLFRCFTRLGATRAGCPRAIGRLGR